MLALALALSLSAAPGAPTLMGDERLKLRQQIDDLTLEMATIDPSWPSGTVLTTLVGSSFGPSFTLLGALLLAAAIAAVPGLLASAIVLLGVGVAGDTLMILGLVQGTRASSAARSRRDALLLERDQKRQQLQTLVEPAVSIAF
jgi:hypothetical protein